VATHATTDTPNGASLALRAGDAQIELAPATGGALAGFTYQGIDVLRPTPATVRAERNVRGHACYPLVPYSNRIANARLTFDDHEYRLQKNFGDHPHSIHGIGWQRRWHVDAIEDDRALLSLVHDPKTAPDSATSADGHAWPWPFRATQSFAVAANDGGALLTMKLTLTNTGDAVFPFGLGWHPFFVRTGRTEIGFLADAVWQTDATQLPTHRIAIPRDWCFAPQRSPGAGPIDNVFTGWRGEAKVRDPDRGIEVEIAADRSCSFLVVYVPPGRDFLAIEPVTHMTDAFNRAAGGERDTGTRTLRPGEGFSVTMRIFARPLP
jgi:aldose 1-epimerase